MALTKTRRTIQPVAAQGSLGLAEVEAAVRAVHVAPAASGWVVLKIGPKRIRRTFPSKGEAMAYAAKLTRRQPREIAVHGADGKVERRMPGAAAIELQ